MRYFFATITAVLFSLSSSAQIVEFFNEDFNAGFPSGWIAVDEDSLIPAASVSYIGGSFSVREDFDTTGTGDSILVATSWFNPSGQSDNWLISPQVTLKSNGNQLAWQSRSKDPSYPDAFQVLVSTSGSSISDFTDTAFITGAELPTWQDRLIDLDAYAGQAVHIAFRHNSTDKFILCLDNIHLWADTTLSVSELEMQFNIELYPNPSSDQLFYSIQSSGSSFSYGEELEISIIDFQGRWVKQMKSNGSFTGVGSFSVSEFDKGIYFVVFRQGDRIIGRKKFIRN